MAAPMDEDDLLAERLAATRRHAGANRSGNIKLVYLQCYFVTIATILGTGILGLPVTLSHSGLYPFLISFFLGFFVQALLIVFFTDLLQRAYAAQLISYKDESPESVPLNSLEDEDDEFDEIDLEDDHDGTGPVLAGHVIIPKDINVRPPDLHLLGKLFLGCGFQQLFDIILIIQFIALLTSYALAGSEAYAEVIGISHFYVIPVFVWVLTLAIVFALQCIQPVVSILTFAKGTVLLGTVAVTFYVGAEVHHDVSNDFAFIGAPFLMGTVALGGVINVMPLLYSKIAPVRSQVSGFRTAIVSGLTTCAVLNVLWCWAVLDIVPQVNSCFSYNMKGNNSNHQGPLVTALNTNQQYVCTHNLSLESAALRGEISTIPLTKIIQEVYPAYTWVAFLVELFIMISITVSYLTIGAAMHHTLSGWIQSMWGKDKVSSYSNKIRVVSKCQRCCNAECVCRSTVSLVAFGIVFIVAMLNPQGFETMLEKASSFFINLEAGLFVFMMIRKSRCRENRKLKIPLPLSRPVAYLQFLIPLYFLFAVGYDVYHSVDDIINGLETHIEPNTSLHSITTAFNKTAASIAR